MNFYVLWLAALVVALAPEAGFAQESGGGTTGGTSAPPATGGGMGDLWIFFLMPLALVVFMMLVMRPQQKEQKQREQMLKELKKNDRVVTVGGVVAKVANISPENKTVKLMLDEKSGSCMTVTLSSVSRILTGDEKADAGEDSK